MTSFNLNYFHKQSHWGLRLQHINFGEDIDIQCIPVSHGLNSAQHRVGTEYLGVKGASRASCRE